MMRLYTRQEVETILSRDFGAKPSGIDIIFADLWQMPNGYFLTVPKPDPGFEKYTPTELQNMLQEAHSLAARPPLSAP